LGIDFHNKILAFISYVFPCLEYILNTTEFEVGSLPDILNSKSKIVSNKRLINEGLLSIKE